MSSSSSLFETLIIFIVAIIFFSSYLSLLFSVVLLFVLFIVLYFSYPVSCVFFTLLSVIRWKSEKIANEASSSSWKKIIHNKTRKIHYICKNIINPSILVLLVTISVVWCTHEWHVRLKCKTDSFKQKNFDIFFFIVCVVVHKKICCNFSVLCVSVGFFPFSSIKKIFCVWNFQSEKNAFEWTRIVDCGYRWNLSVTDQVR